MFGETYRGKRVFVTGHTGFKGAWLSLWLKQLGAEVFGFALAPPSRPNLYDLIKRGVFAAETEGDIRDRERLSSALDDAQPDIVFHLAAQALVRQSYVAPLETFEVNVNGTANLLEAIRKAGRACSAVMVTTDKCYENQEWLHAYREVDPLGGCDPYSASKAAAELVISAYRRSFFSSGENPHVRVASARAGNVIGGGDWAVDRIVPDAMRALGSGEAVPIRNKSSTRPWQHVLEPLGGYLWLGALLHQPGLLPQIEPRFFRGAFNFGPPFSSNRTVSQLIEEILKHRAGKWLDQSAPNAVHEASLLHLATDKAHHILGWWPVWNFEQTIAETVRWYVAVENGADAANLTVEQIAAYGQAAAESGVAWAFPLGFPGN